MATTDYKSIDEYISTYPEEVQEKLERIRQTIRKIVQEYFTGQRDSEIYQPGKWIGCAMNSF